MLDVQMISYVTTLRWQTYIDSEISLAKQPCQKPDKLFTVNVACIECLYHASHGFKYGKLVEFCGLKSGSLKTPVHVQYEQQRNVISSFLISPNNKAQAAASVPKARQSRTEGIHH